MVTGTHAITERRNRTVSALSLNHCILIWTKFIFLSGSQAAHMYHEGTEAPVTLLVILREKSLATAQEQEHTCRTFKTTKNDWKKIGGIKKRIRKFILRSVLEGSVWPGWCPIMARSKAGQ